MERYGSDKPDIRFAMELFDLAPALTGPDGAPASGFRVFDETLAARRPGQGRSPRPGMGGVTRREIDDLTELAKRFGARGPRPPRGRRGRRAPRARRQVPLARDPGGDPRAAAGAAEGDLILVVADAADVANDVLGPPAGRARRAARARRPRRARVLLGPPLPDVQVGRRADALGRDAQPVQRRRPRGRGAADDRLRRASTTARPTTPPAAPGRCSTTSRSTAGSWAAARSGSGPRDLLARSFNLQGYSLEQMQGAVRRDARGVRVRRAAARRHRARHRPLGGAASATRRTSARSWRSPRRSRGSDPMLEAPSAPEPEQYAELGLRFVGVPGRS